MVHVYLVFAYFLPEAGAKGWRRSVPKVGKQKQTSFTRYAYRKIFRLPLYYVQLCSYAMGINPA